MNPLVDPALEERVIALAATAADAAMARTLLERAGMACAVCSTTREVAGELARGAGVLLLPEEAVGNGGSTDILEALRAQPLWSNVPVLLLTHPGADTAASARATEALSNVTVLERPVRVITLVSALRSGLEARRRQYELRDRVEALRRTAERDRFRAALADSLRDLTDPVAIQVEAARVLGEQLGASRVHYAEVTADAEYALVHADYRREGVESVAGAHRLDDFGPEAMAVFLGGATLAVASVAQDPRLDEPHRAAYAQLDVAALAVVPLVKHDRAVAILVAHHDRPHAWSAGELEWLEETAERTWAAVERAHAELALRRSEATLNAVLETLPAGVLIADREGRIVRHNAATRELWGIPPDTTSWEDYADWLAWWPETGERIRAEEWAMTRALVHGEDTRGQLVQNQPFGGGERRYYLNNVAPLRDEAGAVVGGVAAMVDVTARLEAERALRESEWRLRVATEAAGMFTWECDLVAGTVRWSENAADVVGCAPEQLGADLQTSREIVSPEDLPRVVGECEQALARRQETHGVDFRGRGDEAAARHFHARARIFYGPAGRPVRLIGVTLDVTEQRRTEEALREADRRKDEFLATLAHELRNPLAPIRNAVHILQTPGTRDPELVWSRNVIERQLAQLARLLDDLLDLSRITHGRLRLRRVRVPLATVVESAVEISRPLVEGSGHELTLELPGKAVHLDADPVRLAQVFSNLLNNAAKYTPAGGRIRLSAAVHGDDVVVSVEDTGIGIAPEMLPRLFEMFSQAKPALERAQGGLGIGLALAKGLVAMHGGSIAAESEGPGKGSTFVVRLPIVAPEAALPGPPPIEGEPAAARSRVLIADDLKDAADSLAMLLRIRGHEVHTAYDGEQALALAERLRPDLVLLDLGMPKQSGYEVCRRIREQPWGRAPFLVALTGWGQEEDRRRTEEAGFDRHLVKPVDPAAVLTVLAELSERREGSAAPAS